MTFAFASWLGRFLSVTIRPSPAARPDDRYCMEIEVERLPDYLWRDLGFPQPRRPGEDR
jgi:hypothetical protein